MIKALLLDLDGTLLNDDAAMMAASRTFLPRIATIDMAFDVLFVRWQEVSGRYWRRFYTADPFGNRIEFIAEGDGFGQK